MFKIKCTTKTCQRSKNILLSGFCKTCNEAKRVENPEKKKIVNEAEESFELIKNIYNKLKKGDVVDQNVVNSSIIGGILGFISQTNATFQLKARVAELEDDLKTSNRRIESLENWMTRSDEEKNSIICTERCYMVTDW